MLDVYIVTSTAKCNAFFLTRNCNVITLLILLLVSLIVAWMAVWVRIHTLLLFYEHDDTIVLTIPR